MGGRSWDPGLPHPVPDPGSRGCWPGGFPEETKKGVVFPAPGTARAKGQRQKRPKTGLNPHPLCAWHMEQMAGPVTSSLKSAQFIC